MKSVINHKNSMTVWQETEEGMPEASLLIETYEDVVCIQQEGRHIHLNYESLKPLAKLLLSIKKPE